MDIAKLPFWNNKKFNPKDLFKNWEQGVWYDPSDISRYMGNLWPELVSNWTFENTNGWTAVIWTISAVGWRLRVWKSADNIWRASFQINCVIGRTYYVSLERYKWQNTATNVAIAITHSSVTGAIYTNETSADWLFNFSFIATQTSHWLFLATVWTVWATWLYSEFDNVTIKEIVNDTTWSELITNWDFSSDWTGWTDVSTAPAYIDYTWTWAILVSNSNTARLRKSLSTTIWKSYIVTVTHNTVNTVARFSIWYTGGSSELLPATAINTWATTYTFVAWTSETWFNWFSSWTPNLEIANLSVKEITTASQSITMYQDTLWTIPVDWAEEPVWLILDKSRWLVMWPNLYTWWSITWVPIWWPAFTNYPLWFSVVAWKTYRVSIDVTNYSGTNTYSVWWVTGTDWVVLNPQTGNRKWEFTVMALTNTAFALFTRSTNTANFSNISVREISWIPAYQTTAIDRPILKRWITNLQLQSNTYSNAVWVLNNLTQATATWEFIDGVQATTMTVSGTWVLYAAWTTLSSVTWKTYTIATYVRQWTARYVQLTIPSNIAWVNQWANYDLQNWTVSYSIGWTASIMPVSWWYIIAWSAVATANITWQSFTWVVIVDWGWAGRAPNISTMIGQTVLIATTWVFVWAYTAQEIEEKFGWIPITTSTTANTRLWEYYLFANGSNTSMRTNNIDFSAIDEVNLFSWVRKLSDTTAWMLVELWNWTTQNRFHLTAPWGNLSPTFNFLSQWANVQTAGSSITNYPAPISAVVTGIGDISWDIVKIRVNGQMIEQNLWEQWTGNYSNLPLYLFRRAWTSLPFNWNLYWLIIRWKLSTDKQIKDCEKYLTKKLW